MPSRRTVTTLVVGGVALVGGLSLPLALAGPPGRADTHGSASRPSAEALSSAPASPTTGAGSGSSSAVCPLAGTATGSAPTTSSSAAGSSPAVVSPPASFPVGSATHVFTRTTADGIAIRAYLLDGDVATGCGPVPVTGGPVDPMAPCASSAVSIELSDDSAVGQGTLSTPMFVPGAAGSASGSAGSASGSGDLAVPGSEPEQGLTSGAFGVVEGDPVWWVAVQVGSAVADATVTFPDGSTDTMAPVGGVVVLAHHVAVTTAATSPYDVQGTVVLLGSSGDVLTTITLPQDAPSTPAPVPTPLPAPVPLPTPVTPPVTIPPAPGTTGTASGTAAATAGGATAASGANATTSASPPASGSGSGTGADVVPPTGDSGGAMVACPLEPVADSSASTTP